MQKTKEEILLDLCPGMADAHLDNIGKSFRYQVYQAMSEFASQQTAAKDARIAELEAKVNELTMADMTHEYNEAEAEKFRPEYERQLLEPWRDALHGLLKTLPVENGNTYLPGFLDAVVAAKQLLTPPTGK